MPKNIDNFKKELEGFLRANGIQHIEPINVVTSKPSKDTEGTDLFKFHYKNGPYDYGTVTITLFGREIGVYYNKNVVRDSARGIDTGWTKFLSKLKDWSLRNGQMGFKVDNLDRLGYELKKRKEQVMQEKINEGYYGSRNTSYSDSTPKNIKMIIKHNKSLDENDKRYRYIDKIFLETELGERLLLNTKKPSIGRVYARHLAEGGEYNDDRWKHISEIASDINKLSGFVRATKNNQFNESTINVVEQVLSHYNSLKETIKRLQGQRGYNNYFENWKPAIIENDENTDELSSLFKTERIDPRIENALPVLKKINIKQNEIVEASEFETWANDIVEGLNSDMSNRVDDLAKMLGNEELPVGVDALNIKGQLDELLDDDEYRQELYNELEEIADNDPDYDAKDTIRAWLKKYSDEKYFREVLDRIDTEEPQQPEEPKKSQLKKPEPKDTPAPQPKANNQLSPDDQQKMNQLMPNPIAEDISIIKLLSGIKK